MIDLVVASAFMRSRNYYEQSGWRPGLLLSEDRLPVETLASPAQIPCAVNVVWKGNRLLVPAGGVAIQPDRALEADRLKRDDDGRVREMREQVGRAIPPVNWWWD
jgi:hypothetical protein